MGGGSEVEKAYTAFGPALCRKAARILQSNDLGRDVVHGLFADLVAQGHLEWGFPYLYRAVTNRCFTLLRDEKNRRRLLAEEMAVNASMSPHSLQENQTIHRQLLAKLSLILDEKHWEVMTCRYVDDMGLEEIATFLGVSRKTVGKRLDRVRAIVAETYNDANPVSTAEEVGS